MANKLYAANAIIKKKFKNDEEEAARLLFYVVIEKTEKEIFLVALVIKFDSNFITGKFETKAQI